MSAPAKAVTVTDRGEHEADRMADKVTRASDRSPHRWSSSNVQRVAPVEEEEIQAARGGGHGLDRETRALMEPRFGHDFSRVRIHADSRAAGLAHSVHARAFTFGPDIFFGAGTYRPETAAGQRLLAHELTHTVQQRASGSSPVIQRQADDQPDSPAAAEPTEGDKLRQAILTAAITWLYGDDFISAQKIDDVRNGIVRIPLRKFFGLPVELALPLNKPMANYTTCIEFAGQSFRDAVRAEHPNDPKAMMGIVPLLSRILTIHFKEVQVEATIEGFRKTLLRLVDPATERAAKRAEVAKTLANLEAQPTSDKPQTAKQQRQRLRHYRGRLAQLDREIEKLTGEGALAQDAKRAKLATDIATLEALGKNRDPKQERELKANKLKLKQLDMYIKQLKRLIEKINGKLAKAEDKLLELHKQDDAWIRPADGMAGGRPKPGEYVLFGQPPGQDTYTVTTQAKLMPGSFKHISTLWRVDVLAGGWERWNTIDGGGRHAKEHYYFVRPSDRLTFETGDKDTLPTKDSAPVYILIGWIDIDKLLELRTAPAKKP